MVREGSVFGLFVVAANGTRGYTSRDGAANPFEFQTHSNVWKVSKRPIQKQALETPQADHSSWELPELPPGWAKLWAHSTLSQWFVKKIEYILKEWDLYEFSFFVGHQSICKCTFERVIHVIVLQICCLFVFIYSLL